MKKTYKLFFLIVSINTFCDLTLSCNKTESYDNREQSYIKKLSELAKYNSKIAYEFARIMTEQFSTEFKKNFCTGENRKLISELRKVDWNTIEYEIKKLPRNITNQIKDKASSIRFKNFGELVKKCFLESRNFVKEHQKATFYSIFGLMLATAIKEQIKKLFCLTIDIACFPMQTIIYMALFLLGSSLLSS